MEDRMPRPHRTALAGLLTALCLALAGCGSDDSEDSGSAGSPSEPESSATDAGTPTASPSSPQGASESAQPKKPAGTVVDITFKGDQVKPNGVQRSVRAGRPFTFRIVADAPGELHLHSSPEQEVAYPAGTSDHKVTIDQPGVVEVESHDLGTLIVQLEVR
jgi:hypothetical protein